MREYLVSQGDCWDLLAYRIWQQEGFMDALLKANPKLRHTVIFDGPVMINIPDKPVVPAGSVTLLPPWKRA